MHSIEVGANSGAPAFLNKLWKLVEDSKYDNLISWGPDGSTFIIRNQPQFAKEVLPLYFKHNNMASFIRQLNMYGFRKVTNIEQGGLKCEKDEMEFQHQCFLQGKEYLLPLIKRKIPVGKLGENTPMKAESVNKMIMDVTQLKNKQESLDSKLATLKRENEVVWKEVASLRQKHAKQEQIINKMIQFLLSMVQRKGLPMKRKIPLMFTEPPMKRDGLSHYSLGEDKSQSPSSSGPVIHDVTDAVEDEPGHFLLIEPNTAEEVVVDCNGETSEEPDHSTTSLEVLRKLAKSEPSSPGEPTSSQAEPVVLDPLVTPMETEPLVGDCLLTGVLDCDEIASTSKLMAEPDLENDNAGDSSAIAIPTKWQHRAQMADHVESVDNEIDVLREFMNSNCNFDISTLLELMNPNPEDSLPTGSFPEESPENKNDITGNELIQYNPTMSELAEHNLTLPDLVEYDWPNLSSGTSDASEFILPDDGDCESESNLTNTSTSSDTLNTPDPFNVPDPMLPNISLTRKRGGRAKKSST